MKNIVKVMLIAMAFAAAAVVPYALYFSGSPIIADTTKWSEFGTYVGGMLGPVFSLITIYLLIATLEIQKGQITSANAAAEDAQRIQRRQQALMQKQSVEQTFFSWLHSYRDLINAISTVQVQHGELTTIVGPQALLSIWIDNMSQPELSSSTDNQLLHFAFKDLERSNPVEDHLQKLCAQHALLIFSRMLLAESHNLDSMLNTLFRLLHWLDGSRDIEPLQKHEYVAILRAQVSSIELKFIFYFALTAQGTKLRYLINKYGFLSDANFSERLFAAVRSGPDGAALTDSAFNADLARSADIRALLEAANHP